MFDAMAEFPSESSKSSRSILKLIHAIDPDESLAYARVLKRMGREAISDVLKVVTKGVAAALDGTLDLPSDLADAIRDLPDEDFSRLLARMAQEIQKVGHVVPWLEANTQVILDRARELRDETDAGDTPIVGLPFAKGGPVQFFSPHEAKAVAKAAEVAFQEVATRFGLRLLPQAGSRLTEGVLAVTFEAVPIAAACPPTREALAFREHADVYGLSPEWLGRHIEHEGRTLLVAGLDPRHTANPVVLRDPASQKTLRCSVESLRHRFNARARA